MRERIWWRAALTAAVMAVSAEGPLPAGTATGDHPPASDHVIDVGPHACDLNEGGTVCKTQTIKKGKGHKITWRSKPAGRVLGIIIHVPATCPAPFANMTPAGAIGTDILWAVNCKNGQCKSGPAVSNACERSYIYDQVLDTEKCDGMIIIDK